MITASETDKTAIAYLQDNFHSLSQKIIEQFYLQPLLNIGDSTDSRPKKENLKDGFIERERYGALHSCRRTILIEVLHIKLKQLLPLSIPTAIEYLTTNLGLNEYQLLTLTQFTTLFDNTARENYSGGCVDENSGENCCNYFLEHDLSEPLATLFANLIALKKNPDDFNNYLSEQSIDKNDFIYFDYLKRLMLLTEQLEDMRRSDLWKLKDITNLFEDIDEYDPVVHEPELIEFAKQVHQLIRLHYDMPYACDIVDLEKQSVFSETLEPKYSRANKLKYEHADNIFSVVENSMKSMPFFAEHISVNGLQSIMHADVELAFDPFIHGTNSYILPMLEKTKLTLMSPVDLLERHQLAPTGGEITKGGLDTAKKRCEPCFARLSANGANAFPLEKIITNYADGYNFSYSSIHNTYDLKSEINSVTSGAFSKITTFMIRLARAKQRGVDLFGNTESKEAMHSLYKNMQATIQVFYLIPFLGKYIHPNFTLLEQLAEEEKKDIVDATWTHLTIETLGKKIAGYDLDLKSIYENPSSEGLEKVLSILELPKTSITSSFFTGKGRELTLEHTQAFTLAQTNYPENKFDYFEVEYTFRRMSQNYLDDYKLNTILRYFAKGECTPNFFNQMGKKAIENAKILEQHLKLVKKVVGKDIDEVKFTERQQALVEAKAFPLIFVCNKENKINLTIPSTQEFRANKPLRIPDDINLIATDTDENRVKLLEWLKYNKLFYVQITLFDDLKECRATRKLKEWPCLMDLYAQQGNNLNYNMTEMLNVYVKSKQVLTKPDERLEDIALPEPADGLADSTALQTKKWKEQDEALEALLVESKNVLDKANACLAKRTERIEVVSIPPTEPTEEIETVTLASVELANEVENNTPPPPKPSEALEINALPLPEPAEKPEDAAWTCTIL